jgi:hypothetical protein
MTTCNCIRTLLSHHIMNTHFSDCPSQKCTQTVDTGQRSHQKQKISSTHSHNIPSQTMSSINAKRRRVCADPPEMVSAANANAELLFDDMIPEVNPYRVCEEEEVRPSEVVSSNATVAKSDFKTAKEAVAQPKEENVKEEIIPVVTPLRLEPLSMLLMVDLQQPDPSSVVVALKQVHKLVSDAGTKKENRVQENYRKEAMGIGAPAILLLTLRKWIHEEKIQLWALACLNWITHGQLQTSIAAAKMGGVEAVVTAVKLFPDHTSIRVNGFRVLRHMIASGFVHLAYFVKELQGVHLVQETMRKFSENADLQCSCCSIFLTIIRIMKQQHHKDYGGHFVRAGIAVDVATALRNHAEDVRVQKVGGDLMKSLFS